MYHSYPSILLYKIENSHTDFTESCLICLGIKKQWLVKQAMSTVRETTKSGRGEGERNEREHRWGKRCNTKKRRLNEPMRQREEVIKQNNSGDCTLYCESLTATFNLIFKFYCLHLKIVTFRSNKKKWKLFNKFMDHTKLTSSVV